MKSEEAILPCLLVLHVSFQCENPPSLLTFKWCLCVTKLIIPFITPIDEKRVGARQHSTSTAPHEQQHGHTIYKSSDKILCQNKKRKREKTTMGFTFVHFPFSRCAKHEYSYSYSYSYSQFSGSLNLLLAFLPRVLSCNFWLTPHGFSLHKQEDGRRTAGVS